MDFLSLKPYARVDQKPERRSFLEFFINDKPLSELLNAFYNLKNGILENWIGVLGLSTDLPGEMIKLKQLLNKNVTDKDIKAVYPASWTDSELEWYISKKRDELANPEVLLYCCVACGDPDCGGIATLIGREDEIVTWSFFEGEASLVFRFNKYHYFDVFGARLEYLQKKLHKP